MKIPLPYQSYLFQHRLRSGRVLRVPPTSSVPLHTLPALRLPQAKANFPEQCFVKAFHLIEANPSHSSAPRLHAVLVPHTALRPPVPPPGAWYQALSSSLPALPHSFLVCAAWSLLRDRLTPRPAAARGSYHLFSEQTSSDLKKSNDEWQRTMQRRERGMKSARASQTQSPQLTESTISTEILPAMGRLFGERHPPS